MRYVRMLGSVLVGLVFALWTLICCVAVAQGSWGFILGVALGLVGLFAAWRLWPRQRSASPTTAVSDSDGQQPLVATPTTTAPGPWVPAGDETVTFAPTRPFRPVEPTGLDGVAPAAGAVPAPGADRSPWQAPGIQATAPSPSPAGTTRQVELSQASFTAIDVETANQSRASICAVGIAQVRDGVVTKRQRWLVQPLPGADRFDPRNVAIHGITAQDVALNGAPWDVVAREVAAVVGDDVLAAHNATFDMAVLMQASQQAGLAAPDLPHVDSLTMARRVLPHLGHHRLPDVARELGITQGHHHDAGDDAWVCAQIVIELLRRDPTCTAVTRRSAPRPRGAQTPQSPVPQLQPAAESRPVGPLTGHRVVVTGTLVAVDRSKAHALIEDAGGVVGANMTKSTTLLVVGDPTGAELSPGVSRKLARARALQEAGSPVRIIDEAEFFDLLAGR